MLDKVAGALEPAAKAAENLTDLLHEFLAPLAKELGLMLGDKAYEYRVKNLCVILPRTQEMLRKAGIKPQQIPPRFGLPALLSASIEDDPTLQERWAALLVNAASPGCSSQMLPSFVEILKELTPLEVKFLDRAYDQVSKDEDHLSQKGMTETGRDVAIADGVVAALDRVMLDNLQRVGLIRFNAASPIFSVNAKVLAQAVADHFVLTAFGMAFVRACRAPEKGAPAPRFR